MGTQLRTEDEPAPPRCGLVVPTGGSLPSREVFMPFMTALTVGAAAHRPRGSGTGAGEERGRGTGPLGRFGDPDTEVLEGRRPLAFLHPPSLRYCM